MEATQMKAEAEKIIRSGFENGASEDDMKMAMFSAKIPFSQLNTLFKNTAIELGFIRDPKVVTAEINEQVKESDWEALTTWEQVRACVQQIEDEVKGSNYKRIMTIVRPFCKEQGIELPKEVKAGPTGTRTNAFMVAAVNYFNGVEAPTKEGMFTATVETIPSTAKDKEDKCRKNIDKFFPVMWAIKNAVGIKEAAVAVAGMTYAVDAPVANDEMM